MEKNIREKISNYARRSEMKNRALNCKSSNLKSASGITLVALVVTIIVLLILAAVSLSLGMDTFLQTTDNKEL